MALGNFDAKIIVELLDRASAPLGRLATRLDGIERKSLKLSRGLRSIDLVLGGIAAGSAVALGKSITKSAGDFQALVVRLQQVDGNLQAARTQINFLNKEFGASSFSINEMAESYTRLRAAGLGTDEANKLLRQGAEAVAAFGGNTAELNRLFLGMTQAIGKGTLSMEEMRQQIGEAVPAAMRLLADAYNVGPAEMFRMIESGAVESREAMLLLGQQLEKTFSGALAAQAATINGSLGAMRSAIELAIGEFATFNTTAGAQFVAVVRRMTDMIVRFFDTISEGQVAMFANTINQILDVFEDLGPAISLVTNFMLGFINGLTSIAAHPILGWAVAGGVIGRLMFGNMRMGALVGFISQQISNILQLMGVAGNKVTEILGGLGGVALSYGLIGFLFMGMKGFFIGAAIGGIQWGLEQFGIIGAAAENEIKNIQDLQRDAMAKSQTFLSGTFIDTVEKIEALKQRIETSTFEFGSNSAAKIENKIVALTQSVLAQANALDKVNEATLPPDQLVKYELARGKVQETLNLLGQMVALLNGGVAQGVATYAAATERAAERAQAAVERLAASVETNPITKQTLQLEARTKNVGAQIDKLRERYQKLGDSEGLKRVAEMEKSINESRTQGVANIYAQVGAQNALSAATERTAQVQLRQQMATLGRETGGIFSGMFSSQYNEQAIQRRNELEQGILNTQEQLLSKENELRTATGERRMEIMKTIELLKQFQGQQQDALSEVTAAGMLAKDTWTRVGEAIEGSLKTALKDLINGTFDAEKALLAFYDKITDAAIDYLFELIKIQFRQQIIASLAPLTGGGGGAGFLGMFLGGFANGGAFRGGITPFADGGIVRGPTMFGLAGEAGDEAILPLERIGGKLGVNAVGGDGGSYTININAIDTQTGAQFLQRNSQQIVAQLRSADRLNRGYGNIR